MGRWVSFNTVSLSEPEVFCDDTYLIIKRDDGQGQGVCAYDQLSQPNQMFL